MATDYSWIAEDLRPIAFRLARADAAALEVMRHSLKWSEAGTAGAVELREEHTPDGQLNAVVSSIRPVPAAISLAFSDAVHHLRAAIETTLFTLVVREHGPLNDQVAKEVSFPIVDSQRNLKKWHKKMQEAGLTALAADGQLGMRVESLQAHKSSDVVPSLRRAHLADFGMEVVSSHPLVLLQKYSNEDKHRGIRTAVGQQMTLTGDVPLKQQKLQLRRIKPGDVLASTTSGEPLLVDSYSVVTVERPDGSAWVAPGGELTQLWRYVADVVIPTLVLGESREDAFPPKLDLASLDKTEEQLIEAGSSLTAEERFTPYLQASLMRSDAAPVRAMPPAG